MSDSSDYFRNKVWYIINTIQANQLFVHSANLKVRYSEEEMQGNWWEKALNAFAAHQEKERGAFNNKQIHDQKVFADYQVQEKAQEKASDMPLVPKTELDGLTADIPAMPGESAPKANTEDESSSADIPSVPDVAGETEPESKE